jgi:hypothetical protein
MFVFFIRVKKEKGRFTRVKRPFEAFISQLYTFFGQKSIVITYSKNRPKQVGRFLFDGKVVAACYCMVEDFRLQIA